MTKQIVTVFLTLISIVASAQNWALLNPEYKYNYSNDGTDTISNQIFVTHIDTLGPDSFRYELDRIGVVCDTCPASLGGPCDGCYVRVNQPQFLGLDCIRSGGDWYFIGPDTFLLKSSASIGSSWTFNESANIIATIDEEGPMDLFGVPDTVRRILLSNNDTLLLSRSLGLTLFERADRRYDLLGVEGAGVGRLYPDPLAYFDYQPGDQLTYRITNTAWVYIPGGPVYPHPCDYHWKVIITARTESVDTLDYAVSTARTCPSGCCLENYIAEPNWPIPQGHWTFTRAALRVNHPILDSYPGQALDTSIATTFNFIDVFPSYLASYSITGDGRVQLRARALLDTPYPPLSFNRDQEISSELHPFLQLPFDVSYEEGLGVRTVQYYPQPGVIHMGVQLVGAIIGGDTIISPPSIDWDLGISESSDSDLGLFPDPASDHLRLTSARPLGTVRIFDLQGRLVMSRTSSAIFEDLDVRSLLSGLYVLWVGGLAPQRFSIAR